MVSSTPATVGEMPFRSRLLAERAATVLETYDVRFALLFGSVVKGTQGEESDIDIAIEFDTSDGTTDLDTLLRVKVDLERALGRDVDVVEIHSLSPSFARAVFDFGVILVGTEARRHALAQECVGEPESVDDAHARVKSTLAGLNR